MILIWRQLFLYTVKLVSSKPWAGELCAASLGVASVDGLYSWEGCVTGLPATKPISISLHK